jgi:hypothetical protein
MRRQNESNPASVPSQGRDEVALAIGTRCETCHAPAWPIGAPCRYCEQSAEAATRNGLNGRRRQREHESRERHMRSQLIAEAEELVTTPTAERIRREASKLCEWARDVPKLDPCVCLPCTARRVLVEVSR